MYNLRTSTMSSEHIDAELMTYGANTSGSLQRRRERLQRFREATTTPKRSRDEPACPSPPTKRMKLEAELESRGAKTFGSVQRLQQRLLRFLEAEEASRQRQVEMLEREISELEREVANILFSLHRAPTHSYNLRSRKTNRTYSQ